MLLLLGATISALAQQPVRYHFGDDPRWSDPTFDDSAWPIAEKGAWPVPPYQSDGLMWIRLHVAVPTDVNGSFSMLPFGAFALMTGPADRIFVNGYDVLHPPVGANASALADSVVFDLPPGLVAPGATALVAIRTQYSTARRSGGGRTSAAFAIDQTRTIRAMSRAALAQIRFSYTAWYFIEAGIILLGVLVLVVWRWDRSAELFYGGANLVTFALTVSAPDALPLGLPHRWLQPWHIYFCIMQAISMAMLVEFTWATHRLKLVWLKRVAQASLLIFNLCLLLSGFAFAPSMFFLAILAALSIVFVFNAITIGINIRQIAWKRRNRAMAAALIFNPVLSTYGAIYHHFDILHFGPFRVGSFLLAYVPFALVMVYLLLGRAWQAWRSANELRAEFEAARELQLQLVTAAGDAPGFRIHSIYRPASQVGGDFFHVQPFSDGKLLVVVGDVSGKGLPAAMTVSAIIGALRSMEATSPAQILTALNRSLAGNHRGGFVTCCVLLLDPQGGASLANAGHLPPYLNGEELSVEGALPLGILDTADYPLTHFHLHDGDRITLLSDGIVEAQDAHGELFGFARITTLLQQQTTADALADAAQSFGQQDDITVLSLTLDLASAAHIPQLAQA